MADRYRKWAIVESFLVHARCLLHFFHPATVREENVLATDFFPDSMTWRMVLGKQPKALEAIAENVGGEITHLSYDRLDEDRPTRWVVEPIVRELNALVDLFVKHALASTYTVIGRARRLTRAGQSQVQRCRRGSSH